MTVHDHTARVLAAVPLVLAVLCENCGCVSNSTGDTCAVCAGTGGLLSLARVLEERIPQAG